MIWVNHPGLNCYEYHGGHELDEGAGGSCCQVQSAAEVRPAVR